MIKFRQSLTICLFLFLVPVNTYAQKVFRLNYLEVYENYKLATGGDLDVTQEKLIIDESQKKITIIPLKGYKTDIFKILNKKVEDDITHYYCEYVNQNGTVQIHLFLDTFYKSLKCIGDLSSGNYVKYYFE